METIRGIVRNIAIVILLASFLELLLPSGTMRRFVQLVMGLFVLVAILGPATSLLNKPLAFEIPAWSTTESSQGQEELATVIQQGKSIKEKSQAAAMEEYKKAIAQQAKALALTVKGVDKVSLEVKTKPTGEIEELRVIVGNQQPVIKPVEPVPAESTPRQSQPQTHELTAEQKRIAADLKTRLGALLGINEEQVIPEFKV